ncbi:MAG: calcineurin-like phosphoesterase C-terminal domain-containing protein [Bacteroidales bacterium]|nr:calcineurin-like phosphoesterase C-terminal domain-containing protein [Bacteroidales bacterium]
MKSYVISFLLLPVLLWPAGCGRIEPEAAPAGETVISVGLPAEVKTTIGESADGRRKVYWADGDQVSLNGTASAALSGVGAGQNTAAFSFSGVFSAPFDLLYPASYYKDATTVTLPATQSCSGSAVVTPCACRVFSAGASAGMRHLCAIIGLSVLKDGSASTGRLTSVTFRGGSGEQVSGDFTIDYASGALSGSSSAQADLSTSLSLSEPLSVSSPLVVYLAVPAGIYNKGFTVSLSDDLGNTMTMKRSSAVTLTAGHLVLPSAFAFSPSPNSLELSLGELETGSLPFDGCTVTGRVVDNGGEPLEGVVVSDGLICTRTLMDGRFYLESELTGTRFIYLSTPSGYLPPVENGIPQFFKPVSSLSAVGGVLQCGDFVLNPVANPDDATVIFTADPQPRRHEAYYDNIAFMSLDCCDDLYRDLRETAGTVSGRQVYGVCLGDLVHNDPSLFSEYASGLATLGYPTFNVIGNHDYDTSASSDDAGAEPFESWFGPRNYSFNIGKLHFVILDNLIMKRSGSQLTGYDQGLTDEIWDWLRADLAQVSKSSTIMVCAHSPMFRLSNSSERSNSAAHGEDYGTLLRSFRAVHAWAGHTHATFNYVYPSSHRYKNVEVHTLSRSTGELWTNEYLSAGTPRGYTIVEVRGGVLSSWRFHPVKYQSGAFQGRKQPDYLWRDWTYSGGVAQLNSGGELGESYQMHLYPPGAYGDGYLYANVFLYDEKWDTPQFMLKGGSTSQMELVEDEERHDLADTEFRTFYKANNGSMKGDSSYTAKTTGYPCTLFRVAAPSSGSGTVTITDRFGNEYRQSISW